MPPDPQPLKQLGPVDLGALRHPKILGSPLSTLSRTWPDEAACAAEATALAARPALRDAFIALDGPLGAGKTTFVRYLLRALGVQGRIKSPTYAVMEPYEVNGLVISHFDFYRLSNPRDWGDAGFRDVFAAPGLKLAEWAGNAGGQLPVPDLAITITPGADDQREVVFMANGPCGLALLP